MTRLHDNAVRYHAADRGGHVESFFLKANDPDSDRAFWLKFTIYAPVGGQDVVGEVWAVLFDEAGGGHAAFKETYPIGITDLYTDGTGVVMGASRLEPGRTTGELTRNGQTIRWDFHFDPARRPLYLLPYGWMYTAPFPKFKTLTPTSDSRFTGHLTVDDREVKVDAWPGMQGHNWGRAHAERYAWAHCSVFEESDDAIFEGFTARIKLGPVVTPFLTLMQLIHRGTVYDFTGLGCWTRASTQVDYTAWDFVARSGRRRLIGSLWTTPEQMVGLTYRNPSGDVTHCLNSKIAQCELRLVEGVNTVLRLRSAGKAALEVAVKEPDHGVQMYV